MPQWKRSVSSIARLSDQTLFCHSFWRQRLWHQRCLFLLTALFIFYTKSAATLVFEFVWNAKAGQWHKACCPISSQCIVQPSVFTAAGKSAIYTLALPANNRADSMSCVLLLASRWELLSVPVIFGDGGKKLWVIDEMFLLQKELVGFFRQLGWKGCVGMSFDL